MKKEKYMFGKADTFEKDSDSPIWYGLVVLCIGCGLMVIGGIWVVGFLISTLTGEIR